MPWFHFYRLKYHVHDTLCVQESGSLDPYFSDRPE
jgi:hypothetical protein